MVNKYNVNNTTYPTCLYANPVWALIVIVFTEMKGREDRAAHLFSNTVDTHELDSQGFEEIDLYDKVN